MSERIVYCDSAQFMSKVSTCVDQLRSVNRWKHSHQQPDKSPDFDHCMHSTLHLRHVPSHSLDLCSIIPWRKYAHISHIESTHRKRLEKEYIILAIMMIPLTLQAQCGMH